MNTPAPSTNGSFSPEFLHLLGTARRAIDQHVNNHGTCVDCGSLWPCQRAQLAEFTLAAL